MIDDLEAELAATPPEARDREMLAVYADALQTRGDPRGELIAIDLVLEQRDDDALLVRRDELLRAWVKAEVLPYIRGHQFGLLDLDAWPSALDGGHLHHVAALSIGSQTDIGRELSQVAAQPRPWLSRLAFASAPGRKRVSAERIARVVAACPHLRALALGGYAVRDFVHPTVTRLELLGPTAAREFAAHTEPFPAVRVLALDVSADPAGIPLGLARLPALRRLDLRRAQANALAHLDPGHDVQTLEHVVLPMLTDDHEMRAAQRFLDRLPALRAVDVGAHRGELALTHPRATIRGRPIPWPPLEAVLRDGLAIRLGDTVFPTNLVDAVHMMERNYVYVTDDVRAAWDRVWSVIGGLARDATLHDLDRETLRVALRGVDLGRPGFELQPQWARLRAALREAPGADPVVVRWRYA